MTNEERLLLEKAVINLTIENAKMSIALEKAQKEATRNWGWYVESNNKVEALEALAEKISDRIDDLDNYKTTTGKNEI